MADAGRAPAWALAWLLSAACLAAHAQAELPRVPTAQLAPGQFAFAPDPYSQPPFESELMLVREPSGRLRVWYLPVREGRWRLPEDGRWTPGRPCPGWRVDFRAGTLRCEHPDLPTRYRWALDGRALSGAVPDLIAVPGAEVDGHFVLHLRRP